MNIFVLDENPKIAAKYHCDSHVKKMPVESCQMLVAGIYHINNIVSRKQRIDPKNKNIIQSIFIDYPLSQNTIEKYNDYAPGLSFINHPCSIWVRESSDNFRWLIDLGKSLCIQHIDVFGSAIICDSQICWIEDWLEDNRKLFHNTELTPFAQAMPDKYHDINAVKAYRNYYLGEKQFVTWKNRDIPEWYVKGRNNS